MEAQMKPWRPHEDEWLRNYWRSGALIKAIAWALNRTEHSVRNRRRALELPARNTGSAKHPNLTVPLHPDLHDRVRNFANSQGMSKSALTREALTEYLENHDV
jgi:hypothetical protein